MNGLIVMLGGALGALGRYQFGRMSMHVLGANWPWATFGVNIIGGFLMGVLAGWLAKHNPVYGEQIRLMIGAGIMGGFTTFSAFSLETALMIERGQIGQALFYAFISVAVSILALFLGLFLMRAMA